MMHYLSKVHQQHRSHTKMVIVAFRTPGAAPDEISNKDFPKNRGKSGVEDPEDEGCLADKKGPSLFWDLVVGLGPPLSIDSMQLLSVLSVVTLVVINAVFCHMVVLSRPYHHHSDSISHSCCPFHKIQCSCSHYSIT